MTKEKWVFKICQLVSYELRASLFQEDVDDGRQEDDHNYGKPNEQTKVDRMTQVRHCTYKKRKDIRSLMSAKICCIYVHVLYFSWDTYHHYLVLIVAALALELKQRQHLHAFV